MSLRGLYTSSKTDKYHSEKDLVKFHYISNSHRIVRPDTFVW